MNDITKDRDPGAEPPTSELDQAVALLNEARAERDALIKGIRSLLSGTVSGYGLSATILTSNGKNTSETIELALAALNTMAEREKNLVDKKHEAEKRAKEMTRDIVGMRRLFGLAPQQ